MNGGGNLLFDLDLGLGLNEGDEVPCISLQGIVPTSGKILC